MSASTSESRGKQAKTPAKATIDYKAVVDALKAVKISKRSLRAVSAEFGFSKTTLIRYVKKFDEENKDITKLTEAELTELVRKNEPAGAHRMVF